MFFCFVFVEIGRHWYCLKEAFKMILWGVPSDTQFIDKQSFMSYESFQNDALEFKCTFSYTID